MLFNSFLYKNELNEKTITFFRLNEISKVDLNLNYNFLIDKECIDIKNDMINLKEEYVLNKLVNLCMRKGNKKLAYKNVKNAIIAIRVFYNINPIHLLKIAVLKLEPVIKLNRFTIGNKEKIIPRLINIKKRMYYSLNIIFNFALKNKNNYKYFYLSLADSIIEYSVLNNTVIEKNKEVNELAELNKYNLYKKKKIKEVFVYYVK